MESYVRSTANPQGAQPAPCEQRCPKYIGQFRTNLPLRGRYDRSSGAAGVYRAILPPTPVRSFAFVSICELEHGNALHFRANQKMEIAGHQV
jgi:hypothetical protein